jgi:FkbM family methyltransferase
MYELLSFDAEARIGGDAFRIPVGQRRGLQLLDFEPAEERYARLLHRLLSERPGAVLDVGANVGRFMLYVTAQRRDIRYFGFDVQPACVAFIKKIIARNGLSHSHALAVGLSDRTGILNLRTGGDDDVSASVVAEFYPETRFDRQYPVPLMHGDTAIAQLDTGEISLLKIDVEGGELEVLRGLADTIARHRPHLVIEVAPYANAATEAIAAFRRERAHATEDFLRRAGYAFARIRDGDRLEAVSTLDTGSSTDIREMDYLCTPTR